jgi:hypothetical protein
MAVLPDVDRERVWRWFMRHNPDPSAFTKTDLRAARRGRACDLAAVHR